MNNDYIELGPDDVIREGDEQKYCGDLCKWFPVYRERIGFKAKHDDGWIFRRPRSTLIRDAAIDLLEALEKDYREGDYIAVLAAKAKLEAALGKSKELRKGGE